MSPEPRIQGKLPNSGSPYDLSAVITPPGWVERAACAETDGAAFFPNEQNIAAYTTAKKVCARCPVTAECLAWALETNSREGLWGGLSPLERERLKRRESVAS